MLAPESARCARALSPLLALQLARVLAREAPDLVGHAEDLLPLVHVEGDREAPQAVEGDRTLLAHAQAQAAAGAARRQETLGEPAVLLVPPSLRQTLSRFVRAGVPGLQVLAWNEIPDNRRVRLVTAVGK